jgi:hypothetical protein
MRLMDEVLETRPEPHLMVLEASTFRGNRKKGATMQRPRRSSQPDDGHHMQKPQRALGSASK